MPAVYDNCIRQGTPKACSHMHRGHHCTTPNLDKGWIECQSVQHSHGHSCLAGRKSGIWLGSADVQLGNIQQQWNQYKVGVLTRQKVSLYPDAGLRLLSRSALPGCPFHADPQLQTKCTQMNISYYPENSRHASHGRASPCLCCGPLKPHQRCAGHIAARLDAA